MESQQLDMLVNAGLEHAKALLAVDEMNAISRGRVANIAANFLQAASDDGKTSTYSRWMFVKDAGGKILGRYRIRIEDEAAKVNVSKAYFLKNGKGTSWDTGEVNLPRALGLPSKFAKKIIRYRYGQNWMPGGRGDDDHNNPALMTDGIDNDADGEIDEEDEGINDPREYSAGNLKGDDRKFSSIMELMKILTGDKNKLSPDIISQIKNEIPRRATIYSCDFPGSPTLPDKIPSDINCMTTRECRKLLIKANAVSPFEPNSAKQMQLAANLIDYRDENHVLATIGSTYGVEAICFNEILANDESYSADPSATVSGNLDRDYWTDNCGSEDGERMVFLVDTIYNAVPDDPQLAYSIDPRKAWRIRREDDKIMGDLEIKNEFINMEFPDAIGKDGKTIRMTSYQKVPKPEDLPGNKSWCRWQKPNGVLSSRQEELYEELLGVLGRLGKVDNLRPDFPKDYFKHSLVMIYKWVDDFNNTADNKAIGCFEISKGDEESITFDTKEYYSGESFISRLDRAEMSATDYDLSVTINSWSPAYPIACVPRANRTYLVRSRQPKAGRYFKVMVGRPAKGRYTEGYPDDMGVSGRVGGRFTSDKVLNRQWVCNDGNPIRTKSGGWMEIMITSSPEVNRDGDNKQYISYLRVVAPEVVEMYNASATPISLANWRVICNTGSLATQIGRIRQTSYYDQKLHRSIIDDNPVVQPRGHFYLVNDTKLFDAAYGNANNKWGSSVNEQVPLFQMDEQNWGVAYKIKKTKMAYHEGPNDRSGYVITIDDSNLDKEVFNLETIKFVDKKGAKDPDSWNNIFAPVLSHYIYKKGEIFIRPIGADRDIKSGKLVGKSIMILGLPHSGGIVSLTLKNEYDQVCARTVDYGRVEIDEFDITTEKIDPTKNTWVKRKKSSIGGTERKAENRAMRSRHADKFFIKNGPYCSIGEAKNVSTGNDFERLGGSGNISKGSEALGALANVMCSSFVRLESCAGNVSRTGWKEAADEVVNSSKSSVTCKNGGWEVDQWKGQTIRFLTGKLRGEKFPIISNSKNVIIVGDKNSPDATYSSPNRLSLSPEKGDGFSLGPGYASPLCFTRKGGESAEWTWKNALPNVGKVASLPDLNLYIYGLNDAIDTTEFFEENNNASINVDLWNYRTKEFDKLKKHGRYGKQDSFNAGKIKNDNISETGDVRLRLTAYDVVERNTEDKTGEVIAGSGGKQTGIAWFNYAVITPVPVVGRVNANTASPRLLASLPGINAKLAKNIYKGVDKNNKKSLKPYQKLGAILKVKGMTPVIFERCANMFSLDSGFFTIDVEAQLFKNNVNDEKAAGLSDLVTATWKKRFVINLDKSEGENLNIYELEKY